mgnify:CR=1 FL=1
MEMMIKKFCQRYRLPEKSLHELLSHMTEYHFGKGESIVKEGERNSNFYILKKGIWRAYYMIDGTESSLWFAGTGEIAFSSWGYVNNEVSQVNIESVNESIAYSIAKPDLEELFNSSIELSNFGRKIFEQEILFIDSYTLAYGTPSAKERYLTLMEENPELLQYVPEKSLMHLLRYSTILCSWFSTGASCRLPLLMRKYVMLFCVKTCWEIVSLMCSRMR